MAEMKLYELEMLRSRIYHGEQELISTLTPEQFFALLSHDYDTGFAAGKASAQKEILCMLAADGMPVEKIALLLRIKPEKVLEIIATKQAHIEKCRKRLKQEQSMKDFCQYGNRRDDEWEILPWIPDPRPPFKIWVKPEQIAPFFLIPHHPYAISLLLKISDGFRTEKFRRLGLTGSSADWERLVRGVIQEFEENNSGVDLFHFDSDEDVFCVYSQYIDDLMLLSKMIRAACDNEKTMGMYLNMSEAAKA